jgi:hypothetical protein
MPEIDRHRQRCPGCHAAVGSHDRQIDGCIARLLEAVMCYRSSHEYERRLGADPTRSFFRALRDLFRPKESQVEAEVVPLPARGAVRVGARASEPDRPKAA